MNKLLLSLLSVGLLSGCAGAANVVKAFGKDRAIFIVNAGTPYGAQRIVRIGETTNSVTVSPEGAVTINGPVVR